VRAGSVVTLGLCFGLIFHTLAVYLGLAALIRSSEMAFSILQYSGAVYLIYLAYGAFRAKPMEFKDESEKLDTVVLFKRGVIMNITNPKVTLFFLAFLPQFVSANSGSFSYQILILGCLFIMTALVTFNGFAFLGGFLRSRIEKSQQAQLIINKLAGIVFIALSIKLIF
jgi:threonine/homoserine/homoserine lactone efflux protein